MQVRKFGTQGSADSNMFVKSYTVSFSVNSRNWRSYMERGRVKVGVDLYLDIRITTTIINNKNNNNDGIT